MIPKIIVTNPEGVEISINQISYKKIKPKTRQRLLFLDLLKSDPYYREGYYMDRSSNTTSGKCSCVIL